MLYRQCFSVIVTVAAMANSGCSDTPTNGDSQLDRDVATLRAATAKYHVFSAATADGYTTKLTDCMEMPPLGGMGLHFGKSAIINGSVNVANPEVLLYEPQPNGSRQLVAVEYIIPYTILPRSARPPVLFGHSFKQNDTFQLWGLHAWVWQDNPSGMFADWNPTVNCNAVTQ